VVSGVDVKVVGMGGFGISPLTYPVSPFDPRSCVIVTFHAIRLSPLNFCSSESIVKEGDPDDIVTGNNYLKYWISVLLVCID
jgi:hypothetical protein